MKKVYFVNFKKLGYPSSSVHSICNVKIFFSDFLMAKLTVTKDDLDPCDERRDLKKKWYEVV